MAKQTPFLVSLRGDEAYARYLDRLLRKARRAGAPVESLNQLGEYALAVLGERHGLKAPPRARKVGTNQHGEPK